MTRDQAIAIWRFAKEVPSIAYEYADELKALEVLVLGTPAAISIRPTEGRVRPDPELGSRLETAARTLQRALRERA